MTPEEIVALGPVGRALHRDAQKLVHEAKAAGFHVEISLKSVEPLAMRNVVPVIVIRKVN